MTASGSLLSTSGQRPTGRRYWRSLEELADTPQFREFLEREFPAGASELCQASRRQFLKIMGASLGLAGLSGCIRMPEEKLAPYAHRPSNRTPGVPVSYATAMDLGGIAQGLLVTSYDGRPIKIEGNPSHPLNRGAADAIAQASVLQLYDPDRSRGVIRRDPDGTRREASWDEFARWAKNLFKGDGKGICVLSEAWSSPSLARLRERFRKALPQASWLEYEALSSGFRQGTRAGYDVGYLPQPDGSPSWYSLGEPVREVFELARARVIVSLDADLFGGGDPMAIKYARDFADGRRLHEASDTEMNRLYVVESLYSVTGACADHRRALRPSEIEVLVFQLARALGVEVPEGAVLNSGIDTAFFEQVKADLQSNGGQSVVAAGPRLGPELRDMVAAINKKLGNIGKTLIYYPDPKPDMPAHLVAMWGLTGRMKSHAVDTLLILGGNPVYDAPANAEFGELLERVKNSIHLGLYDDETSQLCDWHLSQAHYLESWGDARTYDGTVSIVQPLIEPLFDGQSSIEVVATILGDEPDGDGSGYNIVRETFGSLVGGSFSEWQWKKALADGVVEGTAWEPVMPEEPPAEVEGGSWNTRSLQGSNSDEQSPSPAASLPEGEGNQHSPSSAPALAEGEGIRTGSSSDEADSETLDELKSDYELAFFSDGKVYDGRFANNGWLQEMPEPITRLTWGNAALMSPQTAANLGIWRDEIVAIQAITNLVITPSENEDAALPAAPRAEVLIPSYVVPGMADGVIGLAVGYGRTAAGNVGNGIGQDIHRLRTNWSFIGRGFGVKVRPTGQTYPLATVQDHHIVDPLGKQAVQERIPELIKEGTFADYRRDPSLGVRKLEALSIFNEHRLDGRPVQGSAAAASVPAHDFHRWGMAIDLTVCTGCGACVVACQAENNIPIVGKEQVIHGREMHWIRVDRYFREAPEAAVAVHQPVPCMQCENAPCEEVCPVAATTHSLEGLNMMTYNRCVGTRYCSNNCPFKVRRFNFFDYNAGTLKDLYEPNLLREPISELLKMQKNPEVTVRMRGVMEKCTYCIQRIEHARIVAKREGDRPIKDGEIQTACQQTCPTQAIVFGDLNDPNSRVSKLHALARTYAMLDSDLNIKPRTRYLAKVRNPAEGLA